MLIPRASAADSAVCTDLVRAPKFCLRQSKRQSRHLYHLGVQHLFNLFQARGEQEDTLLGVANRVLHTELFKCTHPPLEQNVRMSPTRTGVHYP